MPMTARKGSLDSSRCTSYRARPSIDHSSKGLKAGSISGMGEIINPDQQKYNQAKELDFIATPRIQNKQDEKDRPKQKVKSIVMCTDNRIRMATPVTIIALMSRC